MGCKKLTYQPQETTLKVAHSIFNNVKKTSAKEYLFGYQGSEKDNEVNSSNGTSYTTEFRQLDTRLGRWFSSDPVFQPWQSSYTSMDNNPVNLTDVNGDVAGDDGGDGKDKKSDDSTPDGWEEISEKEYDSNNPAHGASYYTGGVTKYYKKSASEVKFEAQTTSRDETNVVLNVVTEVDKGQTISPMPEKKKPVEKNNILTSSFFNGGYAMDKWYYKNLHGENAPVKKTTFDLSLKGTMGGVDFTLSGGITSSTPDNAALTSSISINISLMDLGVNNLDQINKDVINKFLKSKGFLDKNGYVDFAGAKKIAKPSAGASAGITLQGNNPILAEVEIHKGVKVQLSYSNLTQLNLSYFSVGYDPTQKTVSGKLKYPPKASIENSTSIVLKISVTGNYKNLSGR